MEKCRLVEQGFKQGSCLTHYQPERLYVPGYLKDTACKATLKWRDDTPYRLIHAYQHKAPECYLSIYQSGCNWSCLKCHSWDFSQYASGAWMSPDDIVKIALNYVELHGDKMYYEPRERATSWHAQELCRACGSCIQFGERSELCPGKLELDKVVLLDGGNFGPARNIISFTGGDLACQPEWYVKATEKIKNLGKNLWVLFETNGYGLTPKNLDQFKEVGIDAFWLDIKAYDNEVHKRLTGASNEWILKLPAEILDRGFVLEVSSLYIPGWVETDQLEKIAKLLVRVDENIPYAIIAFYPQYKLRNVPSPNLEQMLEAYGAAKQAGLKNIRLGNIGRFIRSKEDYEVLIKHAKV